jgi:integrase
MQRPSGIYVRLLLPAVLRPLVGQRFIVRSLGDLRNDAARLAAACLGYALRKAAAAAAAGEAMDKKLLEAALAAAARGDIREYKIDIPGVGSIEADGPEEHGRAMEMLRAMQGSRSHGPATGPMLHEALDRFLEQFKRKNLAPATIRETAHSITLFHDLVDDVPLWDVGHQQLDFFEDAIAHWPTNARVLPAYKGLDTRAIVARGRADPDVPKIGWRTVDKHRDRLAVFFNDVLSRREVPFNPLANRSNRPPSAAKYTPTHRAFRPEELHRIFDPALREAHCSDDAHFFWLPLLCLFTGARLNEIARLRVIDLEHFDGSVWGVHITPEAGRLKNAQSRRFVPLPDRLLDLRFVAYAQDTAAAGFKELFPGGSTTSQNGPGNRLSKWFNRTYLDRVCGLADPALCFHSFRHTLITTADRLGLSEESVAPITGHAPRSVQSRHYIAKPSMLERKARLDLIAQALDLPKLENYMRGQFDGYFRRVREEAAEQAR